MDGDALTVTTLTQPANGTVTVTAGNTVTYTPNPNFKGLDSFTYTANDGTVNSNVATVIVTVSAITADMVTIDKARYRSKKAVLQIRAQSTDATAVLTAFDADTEALVGVLNGGELKLEGISPSPANVLVKSDKGGSATKAVQIR